MKDKIYAIEKLKEEIQTLKLILNHDITNQQRIDTHKKIEELEIMLKKETDYCCRCGISFYGCYFQ